MFSLKNISHKGFFVTAAVLVAASILFICIYPGSNFFSFLRARSDIRRQEAEIEMYKHRLDSLNAEIDALKNDRDSLERFARENFQYKADGDDVYIIGER